MLGFEFQCAGLQVHEQVDEMIVFRPHRDRHGASANNAEG